MSPGQLVRAHSNGQNQFVGKTWSASLMVRTAPQASGSADKRHAEGLHCNLLQEISFLQGRMWRLALKGDVFGIEQRGEMTQILDRHQKCDAVAWTETSPPSLYSVCWHGLCLSPCLFLLGNVARGWQKSAQHLRLLLFRTVNRL